MTPAEIAQAAEALFDAERTGRQTSLVSVAHPQVTMDDAYAIQSALVARKLAAGRHVIGWKIGLTSRAMQQALSSGDALGHFLAYTSAGLWAIPAGASSGAVAAELFA